jgi:hypothetical protein
MPMLFQGRRAAAIENAALRVTVLEEGGHIAEVLHKKSGVSPLWVPHWPSIEPSQFDPGRHPAFGVGADGRLLAGIMGHNLCLDIFGGPSDTEAAAGLTAHGEAPVARYAIEVRAGQLAMSATLPMAALHVRRTLELQDHLVHVRESVRNLSACDRPVGWTEHVTLAPPFLRHGETEFRTSATRSKVFESQFGPADYLSPGAIFDWPNAPAIDGAVVDLRVYSKRAASSAYTAHLLDPARDDAFFVACTPRRGLAFGYRWKQADFPWLGIWEENRSRGQSPWNRQTVTRGLEFGVSPFPETRRQMVERGSMFGVPVYRWIPAGATIDVAYTIAARHAASSPAPEDLFAA